MVGKDVMGDRGEDIVANVGAIPAGTGDPSEEEVMGESEATGETGKVETGIGPAEEWKDCMVGE
jgi:hypothetical protein